MNKIHVKLIAVILTLMLSVCVVVASSYAWMVLSSSPAITGIQVSIGGGNTVLIAPDIKEVTEDGVVHYPGHFSDKMNFGNQEDYDYLEQIGNLNPVSTINGVDWILPVYYTGGEMGFEADSELMYANLPAEEEDKISKGHYVYMDFWVVSPASDYKLRVSTGVDTLDGGSFVIDLLEPAADKETENGYTLVEPKGSAASAVRIGFLANDLILTDDSMAMYVNSSHFDERFTHLKGLYQEPDTGTAYIDANRFTIYEPNGDAHPAYLDMEGMYVETKPMALTDSGIVEKSIRSEANTNLTVQCESIWAVPAGSTVSAMEQRFQTSLYSGNWDNLSAKEMADRFYGQYLQGQIATYVSKGAFAQRTDNLYALLSSGKVSLADALAKSNEAKGATDDAVIIELERNVPQRIRMFIWLEGQDMDCIEQIETSRFAVNIELACGDE